MDCITPSFPDLHCFLEFAQIHVHCCPSSSVSADELLGNFLFFKKKNVNLFGCVRPSLLCTDSSRGSRAPECTGSVAAASRLSCPAAWGILVSQPGIKPVLPAFEGRFLTTGPPGKSPRQFSRCNSMSPFQQMLSYSIGSITSSPGRGTSLL